jgi:hypothetical protein
MIREEMRFFVSLAFTHRSIILVRCIVVIRDYKWTPDFSPTIDEEMGGLVDMMCALIEGPGIQQKIGI